ncbi:phosphate ABC transporter substrate-binding protein PstS [Herbiconiux ginsengi]|uniref:Phosphate-binding protein n=1 Tax=Herbiconiux ginsengi TaxID=381665 RepID=A0A1H3JNL1_9MICO|nr:phosphate ABC transporter substrate-binding protein PstS [Herbiconiux ginsengi]SDY41467.1 phosphate ABC transporter substrate-binding protein, PhoT family [Herbiconiux ginsengi]
MKLKNVAAVGSLALVTALALSACASGSGSSETPAASATPTTAAVDSTLTGTITAGGSSAQANAQAAWTSAFTAQAKGVTINYDKSQGSGGGVTNWLAGSYDFAGSDSPLKEDQAATAQTLCGPGGGINLPIYLDGVAVIYNLPGVKELNLSSATIAKIFSLQITTWNDPAIAAENPDATLPATQITTVTRSDGSGTTTNFTNYLSQTQPSIWTNPPSNAWPIAGSSAQQGGSGVVNTVKAGEGTIGYADHSAIGELSSANIQVGTGTDFVPFSAEGASNAFTEAAATVDTGVEGDLAQKIDYTKITDADAYPIPLISYAILCTTFPDEAQSTLTKAYISFIASEVGQEVAAKNAGSAPIPADMLSQIATSLELVK